MVKLKDANTGKIYVMTSQNMGYVGPFKLQFSSRKSNEIFGSWKMKLKDGTRFTVYDNIEVYCELAKVLIQIANDKDLVTAEAEAALNELKL